MPRLLRLQAKFATSVALAPDIRKKRHFFRELAFLNFFYFENMPPCFLRHKSRDNLSILPRLIFARFALLPVATHALFLTAPASIKVSSTAGPTPARAPGKMSRVSGHASQAAPAYHWFRHLRKKGAHAKSCFSFSDTNATIL